VIVISEFESIGCLIGSELQGILLACPKMAGYVSWPGLTAMLQMVVCMAILCSSPAAGHLRKLAALVEEPSVVLTYHDGPLLSTSGVIPVHLIWYGKFTPVQRTIVGDFLQSLGAKTLEGTNAKLPSASTWWKTTEKYEGAASNKAAPSNKAASSSVIMLGKQKVDQDYSLGNSLKRSDIAALVQAAAKSGAVPLPKSNAGNANAVYLVLTSEDVTVEGFCMSSCGFHGSLNLLPLQQSTKSRMMGKEEKHQQLLPYAWVGNSASQCPGQCAWPFHQPIYGPQTPPLVAPNGDMGIDGMIINIATVLAGAATNPFNSGYFQGDAAAPLEAVSACPGIYGKGSYPGFPGELLVDKTTGASYNAHGVNGRQFLLPAMWDPATKSCQALV